MDKKNSNRIFLGLIILYALLAGISIFLPQGELAASVPAGPMPAHPAVVALANAGIVLVVYGGLGFLGLILARKLALPELWDSAVSNRQRLLTPALLGLGLGVVFVVADLIFSPVNGLGRIVHPPFPTSIVASLSAGIGEEIMFRLFFISLWTWLFSRLILRGRWQTPIYWIVSIFSALAFSMAHLPAFMFFQGWTDFSQIPPMLLVEIILLNGLLSLVAAYVFKKFGFLAPAGVHFWADFVWHVVWGLF